MKCDILKQKGTICARFGKVYVEKNNRINYLINKDDNTEHHTACVEGPNSGGDAL
jgi:hypothetical protein